MIAPTRKAGLMWRAGAAVVDCPLGILVGTFLWALVAIALDALGVRQSKGEPLAPHVVAPCLAVGCFLYCFALHIIFKQATPGRMLFRLQLMSKDTSKSAKKQILIASFGIVPMAIFVSALVVCGIIRERSATYQRASAIVCALMLALLIVNGFCIVFTRKKQGLFDMLAGTVVIRKRSRTKRSSSPDPEFKRVANPYIFGPPLRSNEMFFGREEDLNFIRTNLDRPNAILAMWGPRRTGKTSLFYQILNRQSKGPFDNIIPAYIDAQTLVEGIINSDADFYRELAAAVASGAEGADIGFDQLDFGPQNAAASLRKVIDRALAGNEDKKIAFLIDEFTLLEKRIEDGILTTNVPQFLSGLVNGNPRVSVILTGSRDADPEKMPHMWKLRENLPPDLSQSIGMLQEEDCRKLITEPVAGKLEMAEEVVNLICRLTGRHPFFTQFLCHHVVIYANRNKKARMDVDDLEAIVPPLIEKMPDETLDIWERAISPEQRWILTLMAEMLDELDDSVSERSLWRRVSQPEYQLTMTRADLNAALHGLIKLEILKEDRASEYAFNIDLLRHWIKKKHPVRRLFAARRELVSQAAQKSTETDCHESQD